jgi:hypothetical protein
VTASVETATRPLAVRVLRLTGWIALPAALLAFAIGAILGFDELAKIWAVVAVLLLAIAATAFLGSHASRGGLASGLVCCTLLLLLPPVGTIMTIVIGLIASQTWPELRAYYGLRERTR